MFRNNIGRGAVVVGSMWTTIAVTREAGGAIGWVLACLPCVAMLPLFAIAGVTRWYDTCAGVLRAFNAFAVVPLVLVAYMCWPAAVPQAITSVLCTIALRQRASNEARIAATASVVAIVPAILGFLWFPRLLELLLLAQIVSGLAWWRAARTRSPIPRALVIQAA